MALTKVSPYSPRVGSHVTFAWGRQKIEGKIVEDRGAIGVGGRRLYRIVAPLDPEDQIVIELPLDRFEVKE
jgi:hypothetical protein